MPDTTLLIKAAVLSLRRFTVPELCEHAGLRRSQVDPILTELKKQGLVVPVGDTSGRKTNDTEKRAAHRPRGAYELTDDEGRLQAFANEVYRLRRVVAPAENETADIGAVHTELESLTLLLDICDTATKAE